VVTQHFAMEGTLHYSGGAALSLATPLGAFEAAHPLVGIGMLTPYKLPTVPTPHAPSWQWQRISLEK
jgi:hypothetical protein